MPMLSEKKHYLVPVLVLVYIHIVSFSVGFNNLYNIHFLDKQV